jgi:hypothetical protein
MATTWFPLLFPVYDADFDGKFDFAQTALPDLANNRVIQLTSYYQPPPYTGLVVDYVIVNSSASGVITSSDTAANICTVSGNDFFPGPQYGRGCCLGLDGFLYVISDLDSDPETTNKRISKININTLVEDSDVAFSRLPNGFYNDPMLVPFQIGGVNFLGAITSNWSAETDAQTIEIFNADTMTSVANASLINPDADGGAGSGNVFVVGSAPTATSIELFAIHASALGTKFNIESVIYDTITGISQSNVASYLWETLNSTWSGLEWHALAYDPWDNGIIWHGHHSPSIPLQENRIFKMDGSTGAIIWQYDPAADTPDPPADPSGDRIRFLNTSRQWDVSNGRMLYARHTITEDGSYEFVNTRTGERTVAFDMHFKTDMFGKDPSVWDGPNNTLVYWDEADGNGDRIAGVWYRGYAIFSTDWAGPEEEELIGSAVDGQKPRGWTFELDGHVFYVLDLAHEGVFVYDNRTSQWSKFETETYSTWNMKRGLVWESRILGTDIANNKVWELVPTATEDEGSITIVHEATAMIPSRTRKGQRQDNFSIMASAGFAGSFSSSMRLRFSDDNGRTWSSYYVKAVDGTTQQRFRWDSLGSIQAPGRIFEITDIGGLLRIDGADAAIDGLHTRDETP